MTEKLKDLLAQNTTKAQTLILHTDKAIALLDSVDEIVDNFKLTINTSAGEAKENFETLSEQISIAEDNLKMQQEAAQESMARLMQQVQDAEGRIQETLTNAGHKFEELQTKKQEFCEELDRANRHLSNNLDGIVNQCGQTIENVAQGLDDLDAVAGQIASTMGGVLESVGEQQQELAKQLSGFSQEISQSIKTIDETADNVVEQVGEAVEGLEVPLQTLFEQSIEPETEGFITAFSDLEGEAVEVENAILQLVEDGLMAGSVLNKNIEQILAKNTEIIHRDRELQSILTAVEEVVS